MACCICLETPTRKYPTYLIACGCAQGWFHKNCEEHWLNSIEDGVIPQCPTCRQRVPFKKVYSLAYESGLEQKTLHHASWLFCLELACYLSKGIYGSPICAIGLVSIPFVISTPYSLHYYVDVTISKLFLDIVLFLCLMTQKDTTFFIYSSSIVDIFCGALFMMQAITLNRRLHIKIDPLYPYLIQADVIHTQVLYSKKEIPKQIEKSENTYTIIYYLPPST